MGRTDGFPGGTVGRGLVGVVGVVGVGGGFVGRVVGRPVGRGASDGSGVGVVPGRGVVRPGVPVPVVDRTVGDVRTGNTVVGPVGTPGVGGATPVGGAQGGGMPVPPVATGPTTWVGVAPPVPTEVTGVPGRVPPGNPFSEVPCTAPGPPPSTVSRTTTASDPVMTPAAWSASVTAGGRLGAAWRPAPAMPPTVSPPSTAVGAPTGGSVG